MRRHWMQTVAVAAVLAVGPGAYGESQPAESCDSETEEQCPDWEAVKREGSEAIGALGDAARGTVEKVWSATKRHSKDAVSAGREVTGDALDVVRHATGDAVDAVRDTSGEAVDAVRDGSAGAVASTRRGAEQVLRRTKEGSKRLVERATPAAGEAVDQAGREGAKIWDAARNAGRSLWQNLTASSGGGECDATDEACETADTASGTDSER